MYRSDFLRCPTDGTALVREPKDPIVGETLAEHYVIDDCVGEGAMGRVYRAHHARLERRRYAVKILLGDWSATAAMRIRFAQEAESASRLQHPNVVPVLDFGKTSSGLLYLVMEYVEGRVLGEMIDREAPMEAERVVKIAKGMALGLAHAHEAGLIHRDFKPDNVIVVKGEDGEEVPRIVDFGLAISADPDAARLTTVGLVVGTPVYAAPEQASGAGVVDARADLFSLGVTLYEMLAGKAPFEGSVPEILTRNASEEPPRISERSPGVVVPWRLEEVVRKLMARRKEDRYGSAREVVEVLASGELCAPVPVPVPVPVPAKRRRWAVVLLGVAIAVVAAAIAWVVVTRRETVDAQQATGDRQPATGNRQSAAAAAAAADAGPEAASEAAADAAAAADAGPAAAAAAGPDAGVEEPRPTARKERKHEPRVAKAEVVEEEPPKVEPPKEEPPKVEPPKEEPPKVEPPKVEPPKKVALPTDVKVGVGGMDVHGSLSDAQVERAVERVIPEMKECYLAAAKQAGKGPKVALQVAFEIDDSRRARDVSVGNKLGMESCVSGALKGVRTQVAPDVGTVKVAFTLTFTPVTP